MDIFYHFSTPKSARVMHTTKKAREPVVLFLLNTTAPKDDATVKKCGDRYTALELYHNLL